MEPVNSEIRRQARFSIPVPGMKSGRAIGLGSIIKGVTAAVGIRPCGGCKKRAAQLDRMVEFGGKSGKRRCCE